MDGQSGFSGATGKVNVFKKIWDFCDGKKTSFAAAYWAVIVPGLPVLYSNGIPATLNKVTVIVGLVLTAIGLGHQTYKAFTGDSSRS